MSEITDFDLKQKFRELFPEEAKRLQSAKSQEEIESIHSELLKEAEEKLQTELKKAGMEPMLRDQTAPILLHHDVYQTLIHANGNQIREQIHKLIDGLARLRNQEHSSAEFISMSLNIVGVLALGFVAISAANTGLDAGLMAAAASLLGVEAATVAVIVGIVTVVIIGIIIPILYYMFKPAACLILLINETDKPLIWKNDYNVHGKPVLKLNPLPKPQPDILNGGKYYIAAFISTQKDKDALFGTQYGFTYSYDDKVDLTFAVENPLTATYVDNNCYCVINETAIYAAGKTNEHNKQNWETTKGDFKLSIKCNSGSGSVAYYIARATMIKSEN